MSPQNTIRAVLATAIHRLDKAGCETPRLDAQVLLAHMLNKDRTWLYLNPHMPLDQDCLDSFYSLLVRREQREPVAYLVGHKAFFGLDFQVNRQVLIPRPETELLVETALATEHRSTSTLTIADVGTGSGCIAIALAKNLASASLFALDSSEEALQVARDNAGRHEVAERIAFLAGDLLQPLPQPVDLIVSNPPYVSYSELAETAPEISQYEPRRALDGGIDGLEVIRQLLSQAGEKIKPGGCLLIEIGASQGAAVMALAQSQFDKAEVQIRQDLAGLDRLLVVKTASDYDGRN